MLEAILDPSVYEDGNVEDEADTESGVATESGAASIQMLKINLMQIVRTGIGSGTPTPKMLACLSSPQFIVSFYVTKMIPWN